MSVITYDPNRTWVDYVAQLAAAGSQAAVGVVESVGEYVDTPQSDTYAAFAAAVTAHSKYQAVGRRLPSLADSGNHGVASRVPQTGAETRRRAAYWAAVAARVVPTPAMLGARDRLAARMGAFLPPLGGGEVWPDMRVVIDELNHRDPQGAEWLRNYFRRARTSFIVERVVLAGSGLALVAGGGYYIYKRQQTKRNT